MSDTTTKTAAAHDLQLDQLSHADGDRADRIAKILFATGRYGSDAVNVVLDVFAAENVDQLNQ